MSLKRNFSFELSLKYFLVQRGASALFLIFSLWISLTFKGILENLILIRLLVKLGRVPFHGWIFSLFKRLNLWTILILSTAQKLIPMVTLISLNFNFKFFIFILVLNSFSVFILALRSIYLNKILALSSLNILVWMLRGGSRRLIVILGFMLIYTYLILGVYSVFGVSLKTSFRQFQSIRYIFKLIGVFVFISLGGLPPFLGFLGKVLVIKSSLSLFGILFFTLLAFSSLTILRLYLRFRIIGITLSPGQIEVPSLYSSIKKSRYLIGLLLIWGRTLRLINYKFNIIIIFYLQ